MKSTLLTLGLLTLLMASGCTNTDKKESLTQSGMKCGPGKCGASMVDGSAVLVKKKMNILNQLNDDDSRRECVLNAISTKALYACVREEETGRLSTKDNSKQIPKKEVPTMKCAPGKCGSGM